MHRLFLPSLLLLFAPATPAAAATVYKCTDGKEHIAYQATPCAAHLVSRTMNLKPAPPAAAAAIPPAATQTRAGRGHASTTRKSEATRQSAASRKSITPRKSRAPRATAAQEMQDQSWECRIGNGEVFYQHAPCPAAAVASHEQRHAATRGRSKGAAQLTPVSGRPLPRAEACRRIHAPSASGRAGHERDEDVSSYERSLGRDPCR
jgi:hypothetical protein